MKHRAIWLALGLGVLLAFGAHRLAAARSSSESLFSLAVQSYRDAVFPDAVRYFATVAADEAASARLRAEANAYLGACQIIVLGDEEAAGRYFRRAVAEDDSYRMGARTFNPRVVEFFEDVRTGRAGRSTPDAPWVGSYLVQRGSSCERPVTLDLNGDSTAVIQEGRRRLRGTYTVSGDRLEFGAFEECEEAGRKISLGGTLHDKYQAVDVSDGRPGKKPVTFARADRAAASLKPFVDCNNPPRPIPEECYPCIEREPKSNLGAIRSTEVAYFAEWNWYVGNQLPTPVPDRRGVDRKVPWVNGTRFSILGFAPEGEIFCSYALSGTDSPRDGFTARAYCDLDGDGELSIFEVTSASYEIRHLGDDH